MSAAANGFRVIEVQPTPNPNAQKFVLDQPISDAPISFLTASAGSNSPLAKALFAVDGVTSLLFLGDFVTVNKKPDVAWSAVTPAVKKVLASGKSV